MNMDYRAIIVDFDRTLLHTDKTISEFTVHVLSDLQQSGIRLFAATARPERTITSYCEIIPFDAVTTLNGARTITKENVFECPISTHSAEQILSQLDSSAGMVISLETGSGLYANTDIPIWQPTVTDKIHELPGREKIYKILASHPGIPAEQINVILPDDTYASVADQKLVQYMNASATKWNGIQKMLEAFGILPEQAVYFGDDNDDIEPIRRCGCGVAVKNALDRVKDAADFIAESNDEDGVARFLMGLMKPQDKKDFLIRQFTEMSKEILKDRLTGVYLHGSATMGCYQPKKSDLDFLVVVNTTLSYAEKREFMDRLLELDVHSPAKGIEMSIVTKDVCDPFVYPTPFLLHYSRMHTEWYRRDPEDYIRKMNGTDKDLAAHFTVIRSRGRCLYGLPIQDLFVEVPEQDYLDALWDDVSDAEEAIAENPMYLTLNLARVLAYLKEKKVMSKQEGGTWALKHLPEAYHPLIRTALLEYQRGDDVRYDLSIARKYAASMLAQITQEREILDMN